MKVALVTGAAKGIGAEIAKTLAKKGYTVCINYLHSEKKANELLKYFKANNLSGFSYKADVSNYSEVKNMVNYIKSNYGKIELLVNNAGIAISNQVHYVSEEEYDLIFNSNMKSVFNCSKAVIPIMINAKKGKIINISSIWGVVGASMESIYSASKAAIIGFTKSIAKELAPSNIQVNAIAPGAIDTDMLSSYCKEEIDEICTSTPLMRLGKPEEVAKGVLYFASSSGDFLTGQILNINGGTFM